MSYSASFTVFIQTWVPVCILSMVCVGRELNRSSVRRCVFVSLLAYFSLVSNVSVLHLMRYDPSISVRVILPAVSSPSSWISSPGPTRTVCPVPVVRCVLFKPWNKSGSLRSWHLVPSYSCIRLRSVFLQRLRRECLRIKECVMKPLYHGSNI